jgi:hypothetical protein
VNKVDGDSSFAHCRGYTLHVARANIPNRKANAKGRATRRLRCRLIGLLEEREQIRVDLVLVGRAHAVRQTWIDFQCGPLNNLGREKSRSPDWHDLVVVTMEDECWYVDLFV